MDSASTSAESELDDSKILHLLLELSDTPQGDWNPQFPLLDPITVSRLSDSITNIAFQESPGLVKHVLLLLKRWCSATGTNSAGVHSSWVGRSLPIRSAIRCLVSACTPIIEDENDWAERDPEQQLVFCYAMLGAATSKPAPLHAHAGSHCALLVTRILKRSHLTNDHHRYLAQVWDSVGELQFTQPLMTKLVERSTLGMERTVLWLGRAALRNEFRGLEELLKTSIVSILLRICSQSAIVFQNISKMLMKMMVLSKGHDCIQALVNSIISTVEVECEKEGRDISALYEEPCQLVSALLCVEPEMLPDDGGDTLCRGTILKILNELPHDKVACLLLHRPAWTAYVSKFPSAPD